MPVDDPAVSYPADAGATAFLLTVRGTTTPSAAGRIREVHNVTAGDPGGVAAARSLGDLSHSVYLGRGDALRGEVLFIDCWNSLAGMAQFFSIPDVNEGAKQLFSSRDATVWAPAADFGNVHLAVPSHGVVGAVGLLRVTVTSLDKAAAAFTAYTAATVNRARRYGLVAHGVWTRVPDPGEPPALEVIAVDHWTDQSAMDTYYDLNLGFDLLAPVFAGQPITSSWESAPGDWIEW
jgi:hypothetical protein